jgi:hypothetical protein
VEGLRLGARVESGRWGQRLGRSASRVEGWRAAGVENGPARTARSAAAASSAAARSAACTARSAAAASSAAARSAACTARSAAAASSATARSAGFVSRACRMTGRAPEGFVTGLLLDDWCGGWCQWSG